MIQFISLLQILIKCASEEFEQNLGNPQVCSENKSEAQNGVKSYDKTQRELLVQNATDLYTDMMRCALFCSKELIYKIMSEDTISTDLQDRIRHPHLEKIILKYFPKKLSEVERELHILRVKHTYHDSNLPFIMSSAYATDEVLTIFSKLPDTLKRIFYFQRGLFEVFGITDTFEWFFHFTIKGLIPNSDLKLLNCLGYSCTKLLNDLSTPFILKYMKNLGVKGEEAEQKQSPFTPFDVSNLLAHGNDRLEWAEELISTFAQAEAYRVTPEKSWSLTADVEAVKDKIVNLLKDGAHFAQNNSAETIFATYLDEKNMCQENLQIFEDCQKKIHNICSQMINQALNYYEGEGIMFTSLDEQSDARSNAESPGQDSQ